MSKYKRLTDKEPTYKKCETCDYKNCQYCEDIFRKKAVERLAELEDKIEQGTLIELPCKVGDTLWFIVKKRHKFGFEPYIFIKKTKLTFYNLKKVLDGFNYTVFLTKAKAEAKLRELKGEV